MGKGGRVSGRYGRGGRHRKGRGYQRDRQLSRCKSRFQVISHSVSIAADALFLPPARLGAVVEVVSIHQVEPQQENARESARIRRLLAAGDHLNVNAGALMVTL
jgi:hypothetical protein